MITFSGTHVVPSKAKRDRRADSQTNGQTTDIQCSDPYVAAQKQMLLSIYNKAT